MNEGDITWLRAQADRCRRLAYGQTGSFAAELTRFAEEYEGKIRAIERKRRDQ